jgi:hypothetical protein
VTTSSPSRHADRAQREVQPGVPLDTALACAAPSRARTPPRTRARAARARAGPSAAPRRPRLLLAEAGRRAVTRSRLARRGDRRAAAARGRLLGVLERVDERLPRRRDDVLVDADRAPQSWPSEASMQHARRPRRCRGSRRGCDLVVDELDVAQVRVDLGDRVAQRGVEALTGPLPSGRAARSARRRPRS